MDNREAKFILNAYRPGGRTRVTRALPTRSNKPGAIQSWNAGSVNQSRSTQP